MAAQASRIRRRVAKSQSAPSTKRSIRLTAIGGDPVSGAVLAPEEVAEHREDLAPLAHAPHDEAVALGPHAIVGRPQGRVARRLAPARVALGHLEVGEVLGDGQDRLLQEPARLRTVAVGVVPVGRLGGVDVPVLGRIAARHDPMHLGQGAGDDSPAGLAAVEEGLLVDLLGLVRVADEHDLDVAIAAGPEKGEERVEPRWGGPSLVPPPAPPAPPPTQYTPRPAAPRWPLSRGSR